VYLCRPSRPVDVYLCRPSRPVDVYLCRPSRPVDVPLENLYPSHREKNTHINYSYYNFSK
jgi:hypothetical protein